MIFPVRWSACGKYSILSAKRHLIVGRQKSDFLYFCRPIVPPYYYILYERIILHLIIVVLECLYDVCLVRKLEIAGLPLVLKTVAAGDHPVELVGGGC